MMLRAAVTLIILAIAACALLSSYQHRQFELQVDTNPGAWPENAAVVSPNAMICRPLIIHGPQNPKPITRA